MIRLQIEIDEEKGTIKDAKFKTFGCGSAIASSSVSTEMIIGRTIEKASELTNKDIKEALNLPPVGLILFRSFRIFEFEFDCIAVKIDSYRVVCLVYPN